MEILPRDVRPQVHAAVDVPRLRDRLLEGWQSGYLNLLLAMHGTGAARNNFPHERAGRDADGEVTYRPWAVDRWTDFLCGVLADEDLGLYYVTPQMTELVTQAAGAMPYYQVHEDQLPSRTGLVVFGDVMCEVPPERLREGQRVLINAALWAPAPTLTGEPGLMVVTLQDSDVLIATQEWATKRDLARAATELRATMGPLAYHEEYPLPWGDRPYDKDTDDDGGVRVRNAAVAAMMTTWALMGQRITVTHDEPLPRTVRRQYTRQGRPVPVVRTSTLRQAARPHQDRQERDPNAPGRTYSVRWPVKGYGYWRNTWYPSRQRHEQQFVQVQSYMKGDPDAPLVGGDRVNVLRR